MRQKAGGIARKDRAIAVATLLSWSSGKDSAWALNVLNQDPEFQVLGLVTTVNEAFGRVAMHGVRRALVEAQADAAGLPLIVIDLPNPCSNAQYDAAMTAFVEKAAADNIEVMAFGDLYLEDVRAYREERLKATPLAPHFPLWGRPTDKLAHDMIGGGLGAAITCIDPKQLPRSFAGRMFDAEFIADLPAGVDPCGENGEFHSFVHAGPMFDKDIAVRAGEIVERDGFVFADFLPHDDDGIDGS